MPETAKTLVVLPALNEEATVGSVVGEILRVAPNVTCLVVDDGSSDSTSSVGAAAGALVLRLPFNLGVGGAMRLGFRFAVNNGFKNVVQIDADGQHNPENLPELLAALEGSDLVIGARFAGEGNYNVTGPRRWAMWILSKTLSGMAKVTLTDTTSGFKANGPKALELFAVEYPAEYLGDTIESLVLAARSGLAIKQIPVAMRPRAGGRASQNPFQAGLFLFRAIFALIFANLRPVSRK